ncbi:MAG: DAK2 domain-containing protein [Firmicutes bacterium]|nr:DAK2 domain-containing protein [Bacillota bacterium]
MSLKTVNGLLLKKMIVAGANELNENKTLVDSLNVFPVPDGDTGTNMSLTSIAAARECEKLGTLSLSQISRAAANGSLRGARGNSGVILSQLFRGFSKGLDGLDEAGVVEISNAFKRGVATAYKAVMKPKEGTILTVAKAMAESGEQAAEETDDIEEFLSRVIEAGNKMLEKTTDMLPALKAANVVDAGGKGLMIILQGALGSINSSEEIVLKEAVETKPVDYSALVSVENNSITFGYCTEFFIIQKNVSDKMVSDLKTYLSSIGDSIVVVADDEIVKVHVHTDHPGRAIEKALEIGQLNGMKIDNMRIQHTNRINFEDSAVKKIEETKEAKETKEIGFISISMGRGMADIFKNLGVDSIIEGGQTMNPSTEDILKAIENVNARNIFVLPNNKNIILAAEQAAKLTKDKNVIVVPTKTIPEGISAMVNYEPSLSVEKCFEGMKESLSLVKTCSVTFAVRDTEISNFNITKGDILGMLDGKIEAISKNISSCVKALISKAVDEDSEIISIYYGSDVEDDEAFEMKDELSKIYPECEVELHKGGQPVYYYIISVE